MGFYAHARRVRLPFLESLTLHESGVGFKRLIWVSIWNSWIVKYGGKPWKPYEAHIFIVKCSKMYGECPPLETFGLREFIIRSVEALCTMF